jgi:regulator of extracellular matrix RemA (YlzA/DUF370 family)
MHIFGSIVAGLVVIWFLIGPSTKQKRLADEARDKALVEELKKALRSSGINVE